MIDTYSARARGRVCARCVTCLDVRVCACACARANYTHPPPTSYGHVKAPSMRQRSLRATPQFNDQPYVDAAWWTHEEDRLWVETGILCA
jgi:hypothetical protein